VRLDGEQPLDADAVEGGDAAEVVAHEVDDHQVLGPVLRGRAQLQPQGRVLLRGGAARPGALDRLGHRDTVG
jgi:hypothetical protein